MAENDRIYPALTPEQISLSLQWLKAEYEDGAIMPPRRPSFLELDWSTLSIRSFPGHEQDPLYLAPAEFVGYAANFLDAYMTSLIYACFGPKASGELEATCALRTEHLDEDSDRMRLELSAKLNGTSIPSNLNIMISLLNTLPETLKAKGLEFSERDQLAAGCIFFGLDQRGCVMFFGYPGRLLPKSQFLKRRPQTEWPQASLTVSLSAHNHNRAKTVISFLLNAESGGLQN